MLIVGYCFDIRSERRLCEEVRLNLAYRWFGVISAADLMQFNAQGRGPTSVRAWQLCTYKPISVGPDTPMGEVARLMVEYQIHDVIVSDHSGIVGVVSSMDFVRTFAQA